MKDKLDSKNMSLKVWEKLRRLSQTPKDDILKSRPIRLKESRFIRTQKLKEINGMGGAYERWVNGHCAPGQKGKLGNRFDFVTEPIQANPDSLTESEAMYANSQPSKAQLLMGEAIAHLQGRQKQVYLLTMREGLSIQDTATKLGISKGTCQTHRDRSIRFLESYCRAIIDRERD